MKIIFFGTPSFVDPVLKRLEQDFDVVLSVRTPQMFDPEFIEKLKSLNPDLFVVAAYGQILPKEVIDIPRLGTINIHPSLLPKYRGASPIQAAILTGDSQTGVSFILLDEQMDHGPVIEQFEEDLLPADTFESLSKRLFQLSAEKLSQVIQEFEKTQTSEPQKEDRATFTKILKKEDGMIETVNPPEAEVINRMIRAYYPWPGVWFKTDLNGREAIIKLLPNQMIQVEGKNPMSYKDFINGYEKGEEILKSLKLS